MSSSYFMLRKLRRKRHRNLRILNQGTEIREENGGRVTNVSIIQDTNFNKCRVCLKEGNIPLNNTLGSFTISEAIKIFGGIEISEVDSFPKHLCNSCHLLLEGAILFRKYARENDKLLKQDLTLTTDTPIDVDISYMENEHQVTSECIEESNKSYSCKICKLKFKSCDELVTHKSSKQHRNVRVQCQICNGIITAQLYKKHLDRHQSASHLICDVCGKLYRKDNLLRHLQLHSYELPYHCQVCPYRGRFSESLKIHMRSHTGDKPFTCDKCDLRFLTRSNLNRHLLTHKKDRPFKCFECGRGFYTKRDMDIHFKADHAGIKDFLCKLCGNKYGTRKALMRHELRVHKRDKMAKGRMPLYLQDKYRKCDVV